MNQKLKIVAAVIICFCLLVTIIPFSVYSVRGNISDFALPDDFEERLPEDAFENNSDVRIMSSNLLVHYDSWGRIGIIRLMTIYL